MLIGKEQFEYIFFFPFLGWTPLHEASNGGSKDVIVELLKVGANVNCENVDGILPLHEAVASSHLKVQCMSN
jgi:ankyrin repeat protein